MAKKFKTVEDEVKWWRGLSQTQRERIIKKKSDIQMKRKVKSELAKMDAYLRSGRRTA